MTRTVRNLLFALGAILLIGIGYACTTGKPKFRKADYDHGVTKRQVRKAETKNVFRYGE